MSRPEKAPYLALVGGLLIGLLSILPYFSSTLEYIPGDPGDTRLSIYSLEHGYKWITGQTGESFFDAPFFYPARESMRYTDTFFGGLPFYLPFRMLGIDRETSFQLFIIVGYALNFLVAGWVFNRMRFHWLATVGGAFVFAFSQAALTHSWHIQLHYRFAIPLALYFLYTFLKDFSPSRLLGTLFFLAWQFYCSVYEGYFLGVFLAAFALVTIVVRPVILPFVQSLTLRSALIQGLVIAGFLVVVGALARNYVSTINDKQLAEERSKETITMLPRPISYLVAFRGSAEMGRFYDRIDLPMKHEHVMFVGLIPWVCVIIVLLVARRAVLNPATVSAVVAMFLIIGLTLYVGGFSLYFILMKIPGVVGIRGVTRFILILLFPFALATAQVIHLCTERLQYFKPAMAIFAVLLAAALFMENQVTPYRYSKKESQERVRKLLEQIPPEKQKSVLAYLYPLEGEERHYYYEIDAMLAAQDRNGATMNGYSAAVPLGFRFLRSCMDVKLALDDIPRLGPSFKLPSGIPDVVTVGQPADGPCTAYLGREATAATELPDAAFRAGIVVNAPQDIGVGSSFTARVNVTNQSPVLWRVKGLPDGKLAMRVSCQWKTPGAVSRDEYPNRFEMPYDLQPNETASIAVSLKAPETSGEYELECDAIQELIHWFHHMGSKTGTTLVQIRRDPSTPAIRSNLDAANSTVIAGWAMDQDHPKTPLEIEILDGDKVIATVKADRFRQDLLNAGLGDGTYAFSIPAPAELRDGKPHTVHARVKGTNAGLTGSPKAYAP